MRYFDTSCGSMSCVSTRKDGVPEFMVKALYILSCSGIGIPLVKFQMWSFPSSCIVHMIL